jgi:hypothetical protein
MFVSLDGQLPLLLFIQDVSVFGKLLAHMSTAESTRARLLELLLRAGSRRALQIFTTEPFVFSTNSCKAAALINTTETRLLPPTGAYAPNASASRTYPLLSVLL